MQLSPIFEHHFLNLEFLRRKTVICQFVNFDCLCSKTCCCRSIDSDDVSPSPLTSVDARPRSTAHKSKTNSRYNRNLHDVTPRHVLHCAPVSRSKVKVISSHRLHVSSLPLLNSGNKMLYLNISGPNRLTRCLVEFHFNLVVIPVRVF